MNCDRCEVVFINGVKCHEQGCPNSYKDSQRECAWCGFAFYPENPLQNCCDDYCYRSYNGLLDVDEEEIAPPEIWEVQT